LSAYRLSPFGQGRRRRELRDAFGPRVSEETLDRLVADPDGAALEGERRELTLLTAGLRGLGGWLGVMEPVVLARVLKGFFTAMGHVAREAGGTLDRTQGGALRAFFGAPLPTADHAQQASRAALAMGPELARLSQELAIEGGLPGGVPMALALALHTGEVVVGEMGPEEAFDYTVLGEAVDFGARLATLPAVYGATLLASETTVRAAGDAFLYREVDRVKIKGREETVGVFELVAAAPADPKERQRVVRFERGVAAYRARDYYQAERLFASILEDFGDDGPAQFYVQRCRRHWQESRK
jgi:adenylate cyclase